ncbi:MAG: hypothetical protein M3Q56_09295 [Bacteroidota bacterium]|nr:hypothetical protein [Bacteroidota bacterium]
MLPLGLNDWVQMSSNSKLIDNPKKENSNNHPELTLPNPGDDDPDQVASTNIENPNTTDPTRVDGPSQKITR